MGASSSVEVFDCGFVDVDVSPELDGEYEPTPSLSDQSQNQQGHCWQSVLQSVFALPSVFTRLLSTRGQPKKSRSEHLTFVQIRQDDRVASDSSLDSEYINSDLNWADESTLNRPERFSRKARRSRMKLLTKSGSEDRYKAESSSENSSERPEPPQLNLAYSPVEQRPLLPFY